MIAREFKVIAESLFLSGGLLVADPVHEAPLVWLGLLFIASGIGYAAVGYLFTRYADWIIERIIKQTANRNK